MSGADRQRAVLGGILLIAAATRLAGLTDAPPGINHDEAGNGYDAYSILKTGKDRWGQSWPIVLEGFGRADWRGALYAYLVMPFHALVGPEELILSTRLPAALLGVLTIVGLYCAVSRLSDRPTGLWAAFFLALSPWHLQISRFGHESSLTPAMTIVAVTFLAYARRPPSTALTNPMAPSAPGLRMPHLLSAAMLFALSLYSYPSMRVFTPLFVIAAAVIFRRDILGAWKSDRDRATLLIAAAAGIVVAVPMIWLTITAWDKVMGRAEQVSVFHQSASVVEALLTFGKHYVAHFGPRWLILSGDPYFVQWPGACGVLNHGVAIMFVAGLYVMFRSWRQNRTYRLLLAWLMLYPLAASLTLDAPHTLRSACGLPVFEWLAAIGCRHVIERVGCTLNRRIVVSGAIIAVVTASAAFSFHHYFRVWSRDPGVRARYQQDLCHALESIRPLAGDFDRIFVSDQRDRAKHWFSGEPYIIALLVLPVEPADFQRWPKLIDYERPTDGFHRVTSFGPFIMTTRREVLAEQFRDRSADRVLLMARPGEIVGGTLIHTVTDDRGRPKFEIVSVGPQTVR